MRAYYGAQSASILASTMMHRLADFVGDGDGGVVSVLTGRHVRRSCLGFRYAAAQAVHHRIRIAAGRFAEVHNLPETHAKLFGEKFCLLFRFVDSIGARGAVALR